jgi:hypothetical protein
MGKKARLATRQRVAEMRARQQREDRRRKIMIAIGSVVAVVAVASVVTVVVIMQRQPAKADASVQSFKADRGHTDKPVAYPQNPPAGGKHHPVWQNCGVYDKPVKNENAVHALEHGAVWITYRPDLAKSDVTKLRETVRGIDYSLLSPYPGLPTPVVLSAWGKQQKLARVDEQKIRAFLRSYVQGRQTPEPGAACSGGIGQPLP